jgi:hypothetical protein
MSPKNFLSRISGLNRKCAETMNYDDIFKGDAVTPGGDAGAPEYLPGLRPLVNDVDTYFKEVFAGPVF